MKICVNNLNNLFNEQILNVSIIPKSSHLSRDMIWNLWGHHNNHFADIFDNCMDQGVNAFKVRWCGDRETMESTTEEYIVKVKESLFIQCNTIYLMSLASSQCDWSCLHHGVCTRYRHGGRCYLGALCPHRHSDDRRHRWSLQGRSKVRF